MTGDKTKHQLTVENEELRLRIQELEDTLEAIRSGAVDAIVTRSPAGERVYTLEGADHAYHTMVETMNEGAVTLQQDGTILYANRQFFQLTGSPPSGVVGRRIHEFVLAPDHQIVNRIISQAESSVLRAELRLTGGREAGIPVQIAASPIEFGGTKALTLVISDLSAQKRYETALRSLASELTLTEERERKRIAGVLHDEIAQSLASARMTLTLIQGSLTDRADRETFQEVMAILKQSLRETRALMNDLGNPILYDLGLKAACESIASRLMERHPIQIRSHISRPFKELSADVKIIINQLIRELLTNVVKHSRAHNAEVIIDMEEGRIHVKVKDDGVGFDSRKLGRPTAEGGFGLYSLRERLVAINGSLTIESAPGAGTVVKAVVPAKSENRTPRFNGEEAQ